MLIVCLTLLGKIDVQQKQSPSYSSCMRHPLLNIPTQRTPQNPLKMDV